MKSSNGSSKVVNIKGSVKIEKLKQSDLVEFKHLYFSYHGTVSISKYSTGLI